VSAENHQDAARLAAVPLMPSPAGGTKRFLRMREVQDLLAAHGEPMDRLNFRGATVIEVASPAASCQSADDGDASTRERRRAAWSGTAAITVVPDGAQLSTARLAELHEQVRQTIVEYLNHSAGQDAGWSVEPKVSDAHLQWLSLATSPASCAGGREPWTGRQRFTISFPTAQGNAHFTITADVMRPQPVAVAIRAIERGAVVTAAYVELQQRNDLPPASGRHVPVGSVERLLGMEAARPIAAGQVIYSDDVQAPLLVKRGDEVTVYARGGGIQVRTTARARQDGARGELVQVESLETRERYDAVVVGPREAVVFAGNTAPTADVAERPSRLPRR
jgi:flagellar basal body P-ring formation protein FlgA